MITHLATFQWEPVALCLSFMCLRWQSGVPNESSRWLSRRPQEPPRIGDDHLQINFPLNKISQYFLLCSRIRKKHTSNRKPDDGCSHEIVRSGILIHYDFLSPVFLMSMTGPYRTTLLLICNNGILCGLPKHFFLFWSIHFWQSCFGVDKAYVPSQLIN